MRPDNMRFLTEEEQDIVRWRQLCETQPQKSLRRDSKYAYKTRDFFEEKIPHCYRALYSYLASTVVTSGNVVEIGSNDNFNWCGYGGINGILNGTNQFVFQSSLELGKEDAILKCDIGTLLKILQTSKIYHYSAFVMQNTINCLPIDELKKLFSFCQKNQKVIESVDFLALSGPDEYDEKTNIDDYKKCYPAFEIAADTVIKLYPDHYLFVYKPPTFHSPMLIPVIKEEEFPNELNEACKRNGVKIADTSDKKSVLEALFYINAKCVQGDKGLSFTVYPPIINDLSEFEDSPKLTLNELYYHGVKSLAQEYGLDASTQKLLVYANAEKKGEAKGKGKGKNKAKGDDYSFGTYMAMGNSLLTKALGEKFQTYFKDNPGIQELCSNYMDLKYGDKILGDPIVVNPEKEAEDLVVVYKTVIRPKK